MSINRGMDKEEVVRMCGTYTHTHIIHIMKHNSAIKKNEMMPFAATWIDPEII